MQAYYFRKKINEFNEATIAPLPAGIFPAETEEERWNNIFKAESQELNDLTDKAIAEKDEHRKIELHKKYREKQAKSHYPTLFKIVETTEKCYKVIINRQTRKTAYIPKKICIKVDDYVRGVEQWFIEKNWDYLEV